MLKNKTIINNFESLLKYNHGLNSNSLLLKLFYHWWHNKYWFRQIVIQLLFYFLCHNILAYLNNLEKPISYIGLIYKKLKQNAQTSNISCDLVYIVSDNRNHNKRVFLSQVIFDNFENKTIPNLILKKNQIYHNMIFDLILKEIITVCHTTGMECLSHIFIFDIIECIVIHSYKLRNFQTKYVVPCFYAWRQ